MKRFTFLIVLLFLMALVPRQALLGANAGEVVDAISLSDGHLAVMQGLVHNFSDDNALLADGEQSRGSGQTIYRCDPVSLPFTEDFESTDFPPLCWTRYNIDGGGTQWTGSTSQNHTPGGSRSAVHLYGFSMEDGWLVSPPLDLQNYSSVALSFYSYNTWPSWYPAGGNSVLVSTGSPDPADGDFELLWSPASVVQSWVETSLSLDAYAGSIVYIAFRYNANYTHD